MTEPNETAEPTGASGGYGGAWQLLFRVALSASLAACLIFAARSIRTKPRSPTVFVTVCSGCGSEWHSMDGKRGEPITKCPNCPMSEEEWEALKEQMRKRTEKP